MKDSELTIEYVKELRYHDLKTIAKACGMSYDYALSHLSELDTSYDILKLKALANKFKE